MSDFDALYLWQPVIWEEDPSTIDVTITPGQINTVGTGGPRFVAAIADSLGYAAPVRSKVIPFRSQRFNDDTEAPQWEDRWPVAWCLLLGFASAQKVKQLDDLFSVDTMDESYRDEHASYRLDHLDCRVLADFTDEKRARAAAQRFTHARIGSYPGGWRVEVVAGKLSGERPTQVLGLGEKILSELRSAGGRVNLRS